MLNVAHLSKNYGATRAVTDVSFSIGQGEIVGLLGRNGAGKTTIMKMLSGFLEPDQGQVIIDELNLAQHMKLAQQNIGYLPENLPVYPEMVVADYLDYAAELKGLGATKYAEIKRVVQATDIGDKLLAPIATLSRGYKQRVGVAQAVLGAPKLLILDEPTNGLDPTQTEHMRALIRTVAQQATVILSTHIMQEVDALCDRVLIIRGGTLALDARLAELRDSNHLLIDSSLAHDDMARLLAELSSLSIDEHHSVGVENGLTLYRYRLRCRDGHNNVLQAELAKRIMLNGGDLYRLVPEHRDLDTVFRELNEQADIAAEEVNDAA